MSGNKLGAMKAKAKILAKNPNHYKEIGKRGGLNGRGENYVGGFAGDRELAIRAGRIGGKVSKRTKKNEDR